MSKYYKTEDVIRKRAEDLADTSYWEYGNPKNVGTWIGVAEKEFKDLSTIEVSEDCSDNYKGYCAKFEDGCFHQCKQKQVCEDAISREWIKNALLEYGFTAPDMTVAELIEDAPSVIPKTQMKTQNSNLTFEKVMEEIQTQVIQFPDTHQEFVFSRKIETDGDSIKICGWEYKGIKDREGIDNE